LIDGPREIREAARAVNAMQDRLRVLIADRTQTLATVAHDMRTPLMRLRLAAENSPPDQRDRLARHLAEVETLVASFIAFARDDPAAEKRVRLDLAALLDSLVADHQAMGRVVHYDGPPRLIISGQSLGLKRLFGNLIDNAVKHGGVCDVRLGLTAEGVRIDVLDDGPGVPETDRERIFEPFVRLAEGGAGLGLAAARSIARGHGGDIVEVGRAGRGAHFQVNIPAI
jgi:Signal transduction histidine kinase